MSHRIIQKQQLSPENFLIEVEAAHVAQRFQPGQFVILRLHEHGERIPLTVADTDRAKGTISLIFQVVGKSTLEMSRFNEGDSILNCVGPLGNPTTIDKFGRVVCVGGGTGVACIYPIVQALSEAGNEVIAVIGARNASMLILEEEMNEKAAVTLVATDDGSKGHHGFVTEVLNNVIEKYRPSEIARVFTIGPPIMMKAVAEITRPYNIHTIASLNTVMVDGTGMCGGCRAYVGGKMRLACIDGPEFDAHEVDFDDVISRLEMFQDKEKLAMNHYRECCRGDHEKQKD